LKPSNLFLTNRADGSITVKVLDFGISKLTNPFDSQGNHGLTTTKAILGSPIYMSPEQMRNSRQVDQRADIWSIGVILFEILAGKPPFFGESLGELFAAILESEPPFLEVKRPDVPTGLAEVVQKCLQKNPAFRYSSVQELAQHLAPFGTERSAVQAARIQGVSMVAGVAAPIANPVPSSSPSGSGWQQATGSLLRPPLAPKGKPWRLWIGIGAGTFAITAIAAILVVALMFGRIPRSSATTATHESHVEGIAPPPNPAAVTTMAVQPSTQVAPETTQASVAASASTSTSTAPSTTALPTVMQAPVAPTPRTTTAPPVYYRPQAPKTTAAPFDPLNAGRHG
jgi:serine/threonine-protein kinase